MTRSSVPAHLRSAVRLLLSLLVVGCRADDLVGPDRPTTTTALALAQRVSCALTDAGKAYCWGDGGNGQLGNGMSLFSFTPTPVSSEAQFVALSSSDVTLCGLVRGGSVECWGAIPNTINDNSTSKLTPVPVNGPKPFVSLAVGYRFACGLDRDGAAYCWGNNSRNQLGTGDTIPRETPTKVAGSTQFASISAGFWHVCGLTSAGAAHCWGDGTYGELGNDGRVPAPAPTAVAGGIVFRSITAGSIYTCGVSTTGVGYCWGSNFSGQLGDGTTTDRLRPTPVAGGLRFASLHASRGNRTIGHSCGTTTGAEVYCWGNNTAGQLTTTSSETCQYLTGVYACSRLPVPIVGLAGVSAVDLGTTHSCAAVAGGHVFCWGENTFGELGDGTQMVRTGLVGVSGGLRVPQ